MWEKSENGITLTFSEGDSSFNSCEYGFEVCYDDKKVKVGLHLLDGDGFAVTLNDDDKFGVVPFSCFIYCMKKQNVGVKNFKPFNEMDERIKVAFLDGVAWVFLGYSDDSKNFDKACKHFFQVLSNAKTLGRGFAWRFNSLKPIVVVPATTTVKVNTIEDNSTKISTEIPSIEYINTMENYESKPMSELETNTNIMEFKKINPRFKGEKKKGRRELLHRLGMFVGLPVCGVAVGVPTTIAYVPVSAEKCRIWMQKGLEWLEI